jgi:hypothetical protein
MIGDWLYQLTAKDAISQPVMQRVVQGNGGGALAVNVDVLLPVVPPDRVFAVSQLVGYGTAGAAQTTLRLEWNLIADGVNSIASITGWTANPAIQVFGHGQTVQLVLWPGEQLRLRGVFSAGGANNVVSAGAFGFFLPKGNLQLR